MKTRLILKPGQRRTKSLADKYGDDLDCVRFRYGAVTEKRLKTVELIVESVDCEPPVPRYAASAIVPLLIEGDKLELRAEAKAAGGKWLWFVKHWIIAGTGINR